MPLDHYVSQVHLKNFYSPILGKRMYAIRKRDQKFFTPNAKSVCRIEDGSANSYLREDRVVEDFLNTIEPKYNASIKKLSTGKIDQECIYVISGFVGYVHACSPAGMRISSEPLKADVVELARIMDAKGLLPNAPPELGGGTLTNLLENGGVLCDVDPKFPQAIGIASIISLIQTYGNFDWEILINPFEDSPFFTSDYPIAIEQTGAHRISNRIVPLSPTLAIRICPDLSSNRRPEPGDFSFSRFGYIVRNLKRPEVVKINRLIVRCAEKIVFFRDNLDWVPKFVKKNSRFRVESQTDSIRLQGRTLLVSVHRLCPIKAD